MRKIIAALALLLAAIAGTSAAQQSQDQENACGAILGLAAGDTAGSECSGYLTNFGSKDTEQERNDWLNSCPGSDPVFNAAAARYGLMCSRNTLTDQLNAEYASCVNGYNRCLSDVMPWACPLCMPSAQRAEQLCGYWMSLIDGRMTLPVLRQTKQPASPPMAETGAYIWE